MIFAYYVPIQKNHLHEIDIELSMLFPQFFFLSSLRTKSVSNNIAEKMSDIAAISVKELEEGIFVKEEYEEQDQFRDEGKSLTFSVNIYHIDRDP